MEAGQQRQDGGRGVTGACGGETLEEPEAHRGAVGDMPESRGGRDQTRGGKTTVPPLQQPQALLLHRNTPAPSVARDMYGGGASEGPSHLSE